MFSSSERQIDYNVLYKISFVCKRSEFGQVYNDVV